MKLPELPNAEQSYDQARRHVPSPPTVNLAVFWIPLPVKVAMVRGFGAAGGGEDEGGADAAAADGPADGPALVFCLWEFVIAMTTNNMRMPLNTAKMTLFVRRLRWRWGLGAWARTAVRVFPEGLAAAGSSVLNFRL